MLNVTTSKELYNALNTAKDFDYINIAPGEYIVHSTIDTSAKFVSVIGPNDRSAKFTCPAIPGNEYLITLKASYWNFKNINCLEFNCMKILGDYNYISNSTLTRMEVYGQTNELIITIFVCSIIMAKKLLLQIIVLHPLIKLLFMIIPVILSFIKIFITLKVIKSIILM